MAVLAANVITGPARADPVRHRAPTRPRHHPKQRCKPKHLADRRRCSARDRRTTSGMNALTAVDREHGGHELRDPEALGVMGQAR
jgi:hypothetical protein